MDVDEELQALDFAPRCEAGDHPAEIYVRCRTCHDTHLLCLHSLSSARAQALMLGDHRRRTQCCGTIGGAALEELFEIGKLPEGPAK